MTMVDVLLVEDELGWAESITRALADSAPNVTITHAQSRDSAFAELETGAFDLLICDLRLPPDDGGLDISEEHGFAVHERAAVLSPGTPCYFLTGYGTLANLSSALAAGRQEDLFGDGVRHELVRYYPKAQLPECVDAITAFAASYAHLDQIVVEGPVAGRDAVALRIFARRLQGTRIVASRIGGGLSSARTFTVRLYGDAPNDFRGAAFVKVAGSGSIQDERTRYQRAMPAFLGAGTYAPHADDVVAGIGKSSAAFYALAEGYEQDLFDVLDRDPDTAAQVVTRLADRLEPWLGTHQPDHVQLGTLRARRIVDAELQPHLDGTLPEQIALVEQRPLQLRCCNQHGDLHAGNVLVNAEGIPLVIDYGDVGIAPAGLDAVILELGLLFHPKSPLRGHEWVNPTQIRKWRDLDTYVLGCPAAPFVIACRQWALQCATPEQVVALAYSHALRQLKYPDVDSSIAASVVTSCVEALIELDGDG